MHEEYLGTPHISTIPPKCSVTVMLWCLSSMSKYMPTHPCQKYALVTHLCFFLSCFSFATCRHILLHPYELILALLSPSLPLYACPHIYVFFGEISRPYHAPKSYHADPFVSLFVLFFCALVAVHPTAPIQTHLHPYTPVRTRLHPTFHCLYLYLCSAYNVKIY